MRRTAPARSRDGGHVHPQHQPSPLVSEGAVHHVDEDGRRQPEDARRIETSPEHAVHHQHVGVEVFRLGEDVIPRPVPMQRNLGASFPVVVERAVRWKRRHRGIVGELHARRGYHAAMESQPRSRTRCPCLTSRAPRLRADGVLPPPSQLAIRNRPESLIGPA